MAGAAEEGEENPDRIRFSYGTDPAYILVRLDRDRATRHALSIAPRRRPAEN
jgi:hypothetical protein